MGILDSSWISGRKLGSILVETRNRNGTRELPDSRTRIRIWPLTICFPLMPELNGGPAPGHGAILPSHTAPNLLLGFREKTVELSSIV